MTRLSLGAVAAAVLAVTAACSTNDDAAVAPGEGAGTGEPSRATAKDGGANSADAQSNLANETGSDAGTPATCSGSDGAAVGDWTRFGNGQCLVGIQAFYPLVFGVSIPTAREAQTGDCAAEGACHLWLDDIPSPALWERIPDDGTTLPSTYDVIVYKPFAGNPYGHIASVDRVEAGKVYVMDTNYAEDERRATVPHTTSLEAYGWYHLKKLPRSRWCSAVALPLAIASQPCPEGAGFYCGGDHLSGDPEVLYACDANHVYVARECSGACQAMPAGQQDRCK